MAEHRPNGQPSGGVTRTRAEWIGQFLRYAVACAVFVFFVSFVGVGLLDKLDALTHGRFIHLPEPGVPIGLAIFVGLAAAIGFGTVLRPRQRSGGTARARQDQGGGRIWVRPADPGDLGAASGGVEGVVTDVH